jgi:ergothioneine biosynthesis protein EgtB
VLTATLQQRLEAAWERTDRLFDLLEPAAMTARPIPLRHPFIFYLGHLPAFGWNQVCRGLLGRSSPRPEFDDLFERGIDPPDTGPAEVAPMRWPEVGEVLAYRDHVRDELRAAFDLTDRWASDDIMARGGRAFSVVLEHELMHHETLLYMLAELDAGLKRPPEGMPPPSLETGATRHPVLIPGGEATLGARFEAIPFGWDNEFPQKVVRVPAFQIDSTPVTNGEFLEFVRDGGYERPEHWTGEGWKWRVERDQEHPHAWSCRDDEWFVRSSFDEHPLVRVFDWPAQVSWAEASAFARWEGRRLPTEGEFHRAAYGTPDGGVRSWPWGEASPAPRHGNFGYKHWMPTPVGSHPEGASAYGVHELVGNGWEWTSSLFAPFPGFTAYMPNYQGYSADFFDNRHYVVLGGSWATDGALLRRSMRNWFQPHYPYVFGKFRCVGPA